MKKILSFVPLLLLFALGGYLYKTHLPCAEPIHYRIGTFDTQFGLTKDEYKSIIKQAADVWGNPNGHELFVYDEKASMTINLIYDTRQETTVQNKILENKANLSKVSADAVKAEYIALEAKYADAKSTYTTLTNQYNSAQSVYNSKVDYYNAHGGAPKDEYNQLIAEKARLTSLANNLEVKRLEVNSLAAQINSKIKEYNTLVDEANGKIYTINQSAGKEFNEGEYVTDEAGRRINIYEFTSQNDLKRVLSHELGHALGMVHGSDPDSIMYYLNKSKNLVPTAEDKAMLDQICHSSKP